MRSVRAQCFSRQQMSWEGKTTTRISWDCQLQVVTMYTCRQCARSRLWKVTPSVVPAALQASVCDEQLMSIGGEIALSRNTPPHQWGRSRHSVRSRFQSFTRAATSNRDCVRGSNFSSFDSFLIFKILASFNLFLTFEFHCILPLVSWPCQTLTSSHLQTWLWLLWIPCPPFLRVVLLLQWSPKCFRQHVCKIWFCCHLKKQRASVLLLHVLVATASSSVCDGCSGQFLYAKQLLSHSKNLHAVRVVASDSCRQTSSANLILSILPSYVRSTYFLRHWDQSRRVPLSCVWASVVHVARSLQTCFDALPCLQPSHCPRALPVWSAWLPYGELLRLPWHSFQVPRHTFQLHHVTSSGFQHFSCQRLDLFVNVYTILRQIRTTHDPTPKKRCFLSFVIWTVLDCVNLSSTQFHSQSFDNIPSVSPRSSSSWETCFRSTSISINSSLITLTDLCNTSKSSSRCFAGPIMPIRLVSHFSCNICPKISINYRPASSCINSSHSFPYPFFSYVFKVFSRHLKCSIYTPRRFQLTAVSCKRSICDKVIEFKRVVQKKCSKYCSTGHPVPAVLGSSPSWLSEE